MRLLPSIIALSLATLLNAGLTARAEDAAPAHAPTSAELLAASKASDWRPLDPENTLYVQLRGGLAIIELAPDFAPRHVANVKTLVRSGYFDGIPIIRSQDNYVVQWGDPDGKRDIGKAQKTLAAEFYRPMGQLPFTALPDGDVYAPAVGFSNGFPVARDPAQGKAWLAHCYGMLGAGRDLGADSGGGTELYVVTGHSPRHLDRNVSLLGRVVQGMEWLSSLPRGTGALGFYEKPEQYVPIISIRVAADLPPEHRVPLEVIRTDTPLFTQLIESRRFRRDDWFVEPTGYIELCNMPIYVRPVK
jgi:peptidylprolyl isomerase